MAAIVAPMAIITTVVAKVMAMIMIKFTKEEQNTDSCWNGFQKYTIPIIDQNCIGTNRM